MSLEVLANFAQSPALLKEEDGMFLCPHNECKRTFTSKRNLTDHFRSHHQGTRPHICTFPHCGKSFLRPAHLTIHYRIHTGEKPFECEFPGCGKRWNQKSALKQHMRSHTGEKPFPCTVPNCNKRFSTSSSCKRHILTHNKNNSQNVLNTPSSPNYSSPASPNSSSSISSPIPMMASPTPITGVNVETETVAPFNNDLLAPNPATEKIGKCKRSRSLDEGISSDQEQPRQFSQKKQKLESINVSVIDLAVPTPMFNYSSSSSPFPFSITTQSPLTFTPRTDVALSSSCANGMSVIGANSTKMNIGFLLN